MEQNDLKKDLKGTNHFFGPLEKDDPGNNHAYRSGCSFFDQNLVCQDSGFRKTIVIRICLLVLMLGFLVSTGYAQTKKELKKARQASEFSETLELVRTRNFQFFAEHINTNLFGHKTLITPPNSMTIKNDSVFCDLPFFGRAYYVNPYEPGGFTFEEPFNNWSEKVSEKKMEVVIQFGTSKPSDWFHCILIVQRGGSASLSMSSRNRETISYWGYIRKPELKE